MNHNINLNKQESIKLFCLIIGTWQSCLQFDGNHSRLVLGATTKPSKDSYDFFQTILLNTLVSEFVIIDNNLGPSEMVQGLCMLDANLVVYGQYTW